MSVKKSLTVFFVTDDKPGHKNQLIGLEQSLKLKCEVVSQWISIDDCVVSWWDVLLRRIPLSISQDGTSKPDMVIAAGSSTQKLALGLKRKYGAFSVLLMRPNILPYGCFDAVVVPEHDNPPSRQNVIKTIGVLNKVRPSSSNELSGKGLILIGGESKHYHWDSESILSQIEELVQKYSDVTQWLIGDSRRTPTEFRESLSVLLNKYNKLSFCAYESTNAAWLPHKMSEVDTIWVSPDSVSMVYEALTSGKEAGVFNLNSQKNGRVVQGLSRLIQQQKVMTIDSMEMLASSAENFCESDRVADWLLQTLK
jgi:mitochondrial fission protein ELM1